MTSETKHTKLVVYVDDDLEDISWMQAEFENYADIELLCFSDSCKFLKYVVDGKQNCNPDLIILDINMPVLNGKEILTVLRSYPHFKSIPIALYTTSNSAMDASFAKNLNAHFVVKPRCRQQLTEIIFQFVQLSRKRLGNQAIIG